MKYFTPELYLRGNSQDESVVDGIEDDWELAIKRYNRRLSRIRKAFPGAWQRFEDDSVCLHDAQVMSICRQDRSLMMVLHPEPPSTKAVVLEFTLDGEPDIDTQAIPEGIQTDYVTWMYEEWDVDRNKRCCFEVLLSNGWSVKCRFRDFQFWIGERLFPAGRAESRPVSQQSSPLIPKSA